MRNGQELHRFVYEGDNAPFRAAKFSVGEQLAAVSTDPFMSRVSQIRLVQIAEDPAEQSSEVIRALEGCKGRISRLEWTDLNRTLISASEDGYIRRWDVETGKVKEEAKIHDKHIADLQVSVDGTHFVTASNDKTAKLVDTQTLQVLKTYQSTVPVNTAALSPIYDHVLIGGGQEASQVRSRGRPAGARLGKREPCQPKASPCDPWTATRSCAASQPSASLPLPPWAAGCFFLTPPQRLAVLPLLVPLSS